MPSFRSAVLAVRLGIVCSTTLAAAARSQTPAAAAFVTTVGTDTISVEQYGRDGGTIRGVWANREGPAGPQLYYYEITIGADGRPTHYSVIVRPAGSTVPSTTLPGLSIQYGQDTAILVIQGDSPMTKRIAMSGAYPRLGTSVVGLELALQRLRSAGIDAANIVVNSPLGPSFDPIKLPVLFVRPDSARLTHDLIARLDADGRLLHLHDAARETQRVASIDIAGIVDQWTGVEKPGILLSLSELQRFVGHYSVKPDVQVTIERTGSQLLLRSAEGSLQLIPRSAKVFAVSGESGLVEFETNAAGDVTALILVNGTIRQRAPRMK